MSKDILMTDQLIEKKRALYREIDTIYYQRRDLRPSSPRVRRSSAKSRRT